MWLGEQITDRGVGMEFAADLCGHRDWPARGVQQVFERVRSGDTLETLGVIGLIVLLVGIIASSFRERPPQGAGHYANATSAGSGGWPANDNALKLTWAASFR